MSEPNDEPEFEFVEQDSIVDNAANAPAVARRKRKIRYNAKLTAEVWRGFMSDEVGRKAMWDLLVSTGTFEHKFACGPNGFPQAEATWFAAGQRDVGQRIYHMLARNDRVLLLQMHDENDPYYTTAKIKD